MKYELRENQGIPAPLLALMAVATGLSVANCYYNQPLLGSMAKELAVSDFSASMVATLTQIGYVVGLVFVIPLGDLDSRKKLIQTNYIISLCALLAIALAPNIYWVWGASLVAGASSVMPQFFIPLVSYHSTLSRKVRNVGIIQSCLLIGILGSRVFSGLLADEWGWRSVYLVASVFMLGCFLLIHRMLPELSARSRENYAGLMKSLLRLLLKYPYLQIASLRAALAYGSFFALWSCLAFRMKQAPFFAGDDMIGALGLCGLAGASTVVFISGYVQKYGARFFMGITEHGPHIPGTCDPIYFRNLHCVPRQLYGIKLMLGAELNILNTQGDIDLDEDYWRILDIRIAGIHSLCWQGGTKEENTQGAINAMRNPFVQIISHPGDGTAELDFEALMKVSKETHTLLEINNHSMAPIRHKTVAAPNNLELLELAKKYETPVIFGSDAHFSAMIADYSNIMPLVEKAEFPEELVLNYQPEKFMAYLKPTPEK